MGIGGGRRRHLVVGGILAVLLLGACGGQGDPAGGSAASSPAATGVPESPAPESAAENGSPTDPQKLDGALLTADQLPGWQPADNPGEPVDAVVDPPGCATLYQQTVAKVASDMGATAAYTKDPLFLQEFIDLVDNGAQSVADIERAAGQCQHFTVDEGGEVTRFTAAPLEIPAFGDKAFAVRIGVDGADKAELLYVWVGHKDTMMTLHLDGERVEPRQLTEVAARATDSLKAAI